MDPDDDLKIVRSELMLKDLETIEKVQKSNVKNQNYNLKVKSAFEKVFQALNQGLMVNSLIFDEREQEAVRELFLLTAKPEIFVVNVSEDKVNIKPPNEDSVVISAKIESELASLDEPDQKAYLAELGLKESGIERMAKLAYKKLGFISFLTAGKIEARAWTIKSGTPAVDAAGVIHTDFAQKFIKAKVAGFEDFVNFGGWKKAAEGGRVRQEGRDYIVKDGDVVEFMIGK
jgi:hypothetical protein